MATIHPHINFNGNAEEAFRFYQSVFGGKLIHMVRFKDLASEEFPVSEREAEKLMNISLSAGSLLLSGNDVPEVMGRTNENENRSKISVIAESQEEARHLFNGLSAGGTVEVPYDESESGICFGMFRDKFGIEWMVNFGPAVKQ